MSGTKLPALKKKGLICLGALPEYLFSGVIKRSSSSVRTWCTWAWNLSGFRVTFRLGVTYWSILWSISFCPSAVHYGVSHVKIHFKIRAPFFFSSSSTITIPWGGTSANTSPSKSQASVQVVYSIVLLLWWCWPPHTLLGWLSGTNSGACLDMLTLLPLTL